MTRIHLIISSDPVPNGLDRRSLCGETIPKACAIPLAEFDEPASTILFCKGCFQEIIGVAPGRKYFYAISTGQEARDIETEA